jgi:hypothetical protein
MRPGGRIRRIAEIRSWPIQTSDVVVDGGRRDAESPSDLRRRHLIVQEALDLLPHRHRTHVPITLGRIRIGHHSAAPILDRRWGLV